MDDVSITGEAMSDIYVKGYVIFSVVVVVVCLFVCLFCTGLVVSMNSRCNSFRKQTPK